MSIPITPVEFGNWRAERGWSLERTAYELGKAINSVLAYERTRETPHTVRLAIEALEMRRLVANLRQAERHGTAEDRRRAVRAITRFKPVTDAPIPTAWAAKITDDIERERERLGAREDIHEHAN